MLADANAASRPRLELDMQPQQLTILTKDNIEKRAGKQHGDTVCLWADGRWAGLRECCFMTW